ncbi:MAG TPA: 5-dehydro-2-deoxygluconokinase [Beijerinckiaceae bacterium]|nr:5-dehydro-2-deoxygluconokinase [Beijerinckiaceae bacterium]
MSPALDVVTIGRSSVDLYGQQIGGRLEDMASFAKSVGGSPTNTAIGASRLGLKAGLVTRVGDEHFGRFIREQLLREGVDTRGVKTDPKRLTALAVLGVQDDKRFPLIFYRHDCADMGLVEDDIDDGYIASAKAVCLSGTHFSTATTDAMNRKAIRAAKAAGRLVAFDVDYRPSLWGLAGLGAGEERYIRSDTVTAHLQTIAPDCDLIVGTEEELHILGGSQDTLEALRRIRALTRATLVCKRGPIGCVVFPDAIPGSLEHGIKGPGFPVEVYNVLGAGDAFMGGFLRGWLRDEPLEQACAYANACGAFAVSRLLCSPEYPTWEELQHFLRHGAATPRLRLDPALGHIHWATTRRPAPATLKALAIDHRWQLEAMADRLGVGRERISGFKRLAVRAVAQVAASTAGACFEARPPGLAPQHEGSGVDRELPSPHAEVRAERASKHAPGEGLRPYRIERPPHPDGSAVSTSPSGRGWGLLLDGTYGREALFEAAEHGFWIGRPVEKPGSRPLAFETPDLGSHLAKWPLAHTVKCLCFYHPGDPPELMARQEAALVAVQDACRTTGRELLIEIIASKHGVVADTTAADVLERLYALGLKPDWWKLEPQTSAAGWRAIEDTIGAGDPYCRGVVLLGLEAPEEELVAAFALAAQNPVVKGFAIGRTIFAAAAEKWLAGSMPDDEAVAEMAARFGRLCQAWDRARSAG